MRILHWTDDYLPKIGGAETFVRDLAREQMAMGHEVLVSAMAFPGAPDQEWMDGIRVVRHPVSHMQIQANPGLMGRILRTSQEIHKTFRPDVVHMHGHVPVPWLHLTRQPVAASPCVLTLHGPLEATDPGRLRLCHQVSVLVTVSEYLRNSLPPSLSDLAEKTVTIHNGVRWPSTSGGPAPASGSVLLMLGRAIPEKGFDVAIRAMPSVPEARLIIGGDGPSLGSLRALVQETGVGDRVDFRGWVPPDEVPALINTCSTVVMPSRWQEPFGLVAVQAAQMARPIIASNVGGLPEIVKHQETGLLIPAEDPLALAHAVQYMIQHPTEANRMGKAAQERARSLFPISDCALAYQAAYEKSLAN
ncbi:MAG: glycosyltransferase family 4 protein [Verrucomicrobium sp.]|nr:glycosyltransferase family 4 protein [Verrucomicrobium sp.]